MAGSGTYAIDVPATFSAVLFMGCAPRRKFGTDQQDVNANGVPKWSADCAVTFSPVNGSQASSEVISVTIAAPSEPAAGINPGTPVVLEGLRLGLSAPEKGDNGRIRGGRAWWQATGIRSAQHSGNGQARESAKAAV